MTWRPTIRNECVWYVLEVPLQISSYQPQHSEKTASNILPSLKFSPAQGVDWVLRAVGIMIQGLVTKKRLEGIGAPFPEHFFGIELWSAGFVH